MADDGSLTPAQRQLAESNKRFNQTIGEGAILGILAGAALGAAFGGVRGAVIGAASGGLVGAGAGYSVARTNLQHASTEANLKKAIFEANADAESYQQSAVASQQIAADARMQIASLDRQYRAKSITAEQYRNSMISYNDSAEIIRKQIGQMDPEIESLRTDAMIMPVGSDALATSASRIERARILEQKSLKDLESALAAVPAG
jgi:outer membrane lipoprotein SlyB